MNMEEETPFPWHFNSYNVYCFNHLHLQTSYRVPDETLLELTAGISHYVPNTESQGTNNERLHRDEVTLTELLNYTSTSTYWTCKLL